MSDAEFIRSAVDKITGGVEETRYATVKGLAKLQSTGVVPLLMRAAGDSSYRVREEALKGICSFPRDVIFPRLEDFLRNHENANLRTAAIEAFPRYGFDATPFLLQLLKDWDEEIRMFSAQILGDVLDPASVDDLIAALSDDDENVRHAAAETLGKIGDARAVSALIDCLHQDFWIQYPAIIALGAIGDPSGTTHLIKLLDDEMLRQAVIEALGKIGDVSVIPVLSEILARNDPAIRNDTIASLVNIQRLITPDGACLPSIKKALDNEDLIDHLLISIKDPDAEIKKNAIIALGWLKEERAVPNLLELITDYDLEEYVVGSLVAIGELALPRLIEALDNPDPKIRSSLIRCIDWIGHVDGVKACVPFLGSDSREVRYQALMAMSGGLEVPEVEDALLALIGDPDLEIQGLLAEVLGRSRSPGLPTKLLPELSSSEHARRLVAVQILARLKSVEAYEPLRKLLGEEGDEVRAQAYMALSALRADQLPAEILMRGLKDSSPTVRKAVAKCVTANSNDVNDSLLMLLADPDPDVRLSAIETLGRIGDAACVPQFKQAFAAGSKSVRMAIVRAMGAIDHKDSTRFLADLLKEADSDLKRTALESLGKIKDKRATPDLIVALDDADWSVRSAAIQALAKLGDRRCSARLLEKLSDVDDVIKKEAILALGVLKSREAVNHILPLIHNENLQLEVLAALEKLGVPDLAFFAEFFDRSNTRLKCLLVDLLGRLKDPSAIGFLTKVLEEEFYTVRRHAAKALGQLGDRQAIGPLLKAQKEDPSDEVQKEAALALKKLDARQ